MTTRQPHATGLLVALLLASLPLSSATADRSDFTLASSVPDDVFLCVAGRTNPEREFLNQYNQEIFDAIMRAGIVDDTLGILGLFMGSDEMAEFERVKARFIDLATDVDWQALGAREMVFAERFDWPTQFTGHRVFVGPPAMVVMFRVDPAQAPEHYRGLSALLEAGVEEVNNLADKGVLKVDKSKNLGAELSSVRIFTGPPRPPEIDVRMTKKGAEQLARISGENMGRKFAIIFDGKLLTAPTINSRISSRAVIRHDFSEEEARKIAEAINTAAKHARENPGAPSRFQCRLVAQNGEKQPFDEFPDPYDTTGQAPKLRVYKQVLMDESAVELAKAVTGDASRAGLALHVGYREDVVLAVMGDGMLEDVLGLLSGTKDKGALADDKRYVDAFAQLPAPEDEMVFFDLQGMLKPIANLIESIAELEARESADDVVMNSSKSGKSWDLCMQAWEAYEGEDYVKGLTLTQKAHELAPNDSRVLYYLACFHALNDDPDKAIDFLEQAVDGGFYCPRHIIRDPDLRALHNTDRFEAALSKARRMAGKHSGSEALRWAGLMRYILHQTMDAVGIIDYTAAVVSTDGHATVTDSVAVMVPDARNRPIYRIVGQPDHMTDFSKYLPKETVSFSVSSGFDLAALNGYVMDMIRGAGPLGETLLEHWAEFQEEVGFDLERDLISWFNGDSTTVTLDDGGWAMFVKVSNESLARQKVAALVELLSEQLTELSVGNPMLAMLAVTASPADDERLPGFESLSFMVSPEPFVWGVIDENLVIASSADAAALCLATARGEHPNVLKNARVMKEALVPDGAFTMVSLTDQRKLGDELSELMGALSMGVGMFAAFVPEPEIRPVVGRIAAICGKLTPILRKIDYIKSTASTTTFDGRMWHTRSVTNYFSPEERAKNRSR